MTNRKVGLCLAFNGTNYGMLLQAFATQKMIKKMGFDSEIIDYRSGRKKGLRLSLGTAIVSMKAIKEKINKTLFNPSNNIHNPLYIENINARKKVADEFRNRYLENIVECVGITALRNLSSKYSSVLVGSDQLWLPSTAVTNFYTLRFAQAQVNRISYATSMGVSKYPKYLYKDARDYLSEINYLSVREFSGQKLIKEIAHIDAEVVLDPTYLFTKKEWNDLVPDVNILEDKYVLCYFLSEYTEAKKMACSYAKLHHLKCVTIMSNECIADDSMFDTVLTGKTPFEFINLIRHAEYVFTDSFHGMAFSIINNIDFNVFYRKRLDVKEQRNTRIDNLLFIFDLKDRLVQDHKLDSANTSSIDYNQVESKITPLREKSLLFLKHALYKEEK